MSLFAQISLTIGLAFNTISIILLINSLARQNRRILNSEMLQEGLERQVLELSMIELRRKHGTGIPRMAEDTEVAE